MNKHRGKISPGQLFCLLFVSRLTGLLTFTASGGSGLSPGDAALLPAVFAAITLALSLPVIRLSEKYSPPTIDGRPALSRAPADAAAAFLRTAFFLWGAVVTTARFSLFIGTALFRDSPTAPLLALLLLGCAYAASKGIEALGRLSLLICAAVMLPVAAAACSLIGSAEAANLTPPLYDGAGGVLRAGLASASRTYEIAAAAVLLPAVNGKKKHAIPAALLAFSVTAELLLLLIGAVGGGFALGQLFPLYTIISAAGTGPTERLSSVVTGLWVFSVFLKNSLFIRLAVCPTEAFFRKKTGIAACYLASGVVFAAVCLLFPSYEAFADYSDGLWPGVIFFTGTLVPPLLALPVFRRKRQKKNGGAV